ncbi:hypothetical protein TruAng_004229 [Truncatella angustata]|nr:hypothetical protein TruAng_004229 [Truncatella angustata]
MAGTTEYQVSVAATATSDLPASYTGCHSHGSGLYCMDENGDDVQVITEEVTSSSGESASSEEKSSNSEESSGCHFHAGVEHCPGAEAASCERTSRDYNIPLRIGLLFAILATSFIGVAGPIFLKPVLPAKFHVIFVVLKQFGTGIIISTAFVHLYTHATLMFTNECLTGIDYEATTSAIVMAGIFLSFLIDYITHRVAHGMGKKSKLEAGSIREDGLINVMVLEAGIIFHSILIGITLIVAGDSFFITLFIVILFHQMFEGIALGTRIASVGHAIPAEATATGTSRTNSPDKATGPSILHHAPFSGSLQGSKPLSMLHMLIMASAFAAITPIGMAIGIGVLKHFNGNDPSTLIALGTLDALSAGILIWVGLVEMWARDWILGGEMMYTSIGVTASGGLALIAGMVLMSVLGKWA